MSDWYKNTRDRYQKAMAVPQQDAATMALGMAPDVTMKLARVLAGIKPQEPPQVRPDEFGPQGTPPFVQTGDFMPRAPEVTVQASPLPPMPVPQQPMPQMDQQPIVPPMPMPQQIGPQAGFDPNDPRYLPEQWRGAFNPRWQG